MTNVASEPGRFELYELLGVVLILVVSRSLSVYFNSSAGAANYVGFYFQILSYIGWIILLWLMLLRDRSWIPPLPHGVRAWGAEIVVGLLLFALLKFSDLGFIRFLSAVGIESAGPERKVFYDYMKTAGSWATFAHNFRDLFSSLYEEVVFRVYLLNRLSKYFSSAFWPIVISAAMFSVVHGYHLRAALQIFYDGLVLGGVYWLSPRLPKLWVAHFLLDVV